MSNLATITNNILADSGIDDINVIVSTGSYANPAWITSLAWTKITGAPSGIVTGSGTTNYLPKFTGASTIGNSAFFDGGGFGGFNSTGLGSRTFVVNAASGRPLAIEAVEFANVHSISIRPNNTGFNLISSNYVSGGTFLPLSLSGRENTSDFVLSPSGNVGIGVPSPGGKLEVKQAGSEVPFIIDSSAISNGSYTQYQVGNSSGWEVGMGGSGESYSYLFSYGTFGSANSKLAITNSGYLILGGTSSVYGTAGRGTFEMNGSSDNILAMRVAGSLAGYLYTNASAMELYSTTILQLSTAGQVRATITSGGNLILTNGSPSDNGSRLQVNGNVSANSFSSDAQGLNVSGYNFYSQTISGAMGILGHNLRASASVSNQVNVVNSGWYSSMIKMYYSEGITFHTSTTSYNAGDVYPMASTERVRITFGGNVGIGTNDPPNKLTVRDDSPIRLESSSAPSSYYTIIGTLYDYTKSFVINNRGNEILTYSIDPSFGLGLSSPLGDGIIRMSTAGTVRFTISSTGASTFSSSVTASGLASKGTTLNNNNTVRFLRADNTEMGYIGWSNENTNNSTWLFKSSNGNPIAFSPDGVNQEVIFNTDGSAFFNYPVLGSRSFVFRTVSGRPINLETVALTGIHSLYLRPNDSGRHLISSNYLSGGVYLPLALSARENDSDLVLQTSGNVSIGTTTDNGARLQVSGSATFSSSVGINTTNPSAPLHIVTPTGVNFQNAIRFEKAGGFGEVNLENYYTSGSNYGFGIDIAGTTMMVVNNLGNVGIGTPSPSDKLHIANNGTGAYSAALWTNSNSTANLYVGVGGSAVLNTPLQNNAYVMNAAASGLALGTSDAVRMFITSGGNVGIGTASPAERLHVETSNEYQITWARTIAGKRWALGVDSGGTYFNNRTDGVLPIYVTNGGNVLIGSTTDSGYKLTVDGNIYLTNGANRQIYIGSASFYNYRLRTDGDDFVITEAGVTDRLRYSYSSVRWTISAATTCTSSITATAFFESSDSKIKTLLEDKLDYQAIANVTAKYYEKNGKIELGYFAQDFEILLPSAVSKNEDGLLNLSYREVHTAKIAYLEEEIRQLKKKYENN